MSQTPLDALRACAGTWRGWNKLYVSPTDPPDQSPTTLNVRDELDGRFLQVRQKWARETQPQEGVMLIGYQPKTGIVTCHWIDTFHNGRSVMACSGTAEVGGVLNVRGSYAAPPGPDWGWRIRIIPNRPEQLDVEMFNIHPDGKEELAVQSNYAWQREPPAKR